jgi:Flavinator of succinate dehydrogenase
MTILLRAYSNMIHRVRLVVLNHARWFSAKPAGILDPWILPGTPQHMASSTSHPDLPRPIPVPRHNESIDTLRARLVYQTRKRGTLESDLILSTFAQERLGTLTEQELREFDKVNSICHRGTLFDPLSDSQGRSFSTNQTGMFTIGVRAAKLLQKDGVTRASSRSSRHTSAMKERSFVVCQIFSHYHVLQYIDTLY